MSRESSGGGPDNPLWRERVEPGAHWSGVLRRGRTLRVTALEAGANVAMLIYNNEEKLERYNMADTLKAQHTAYLTKHVACYSDMGRVLCSITGDSVGWHDTIAGVSDAALVAKKYGECSFQEARNDYHRNGYDSLLNEVAKYGLGESDLVPNINLFSKVVVDDAGNMRFVEGNAGAGDYIDLRFEMEALVVLSTCQHPMDPEPAYRPRAVDLSVWRSGTAPVEDPCRNRCPENERGFTNTERLYL